MTSDLKLSTEDVLKSRDEDEPIFVNVRDKRPVSSQSMSATNISDVRTDKDHSIDFNLVQNVHPLFHCLLPDFCIFLRPIMYTLQDLKRVSVFDT